MASGRQRWFVSDLLFSLLTTNMLGRIDMSIAGTSVANELGLGPGTRLDFLVLRVTICRETCAFSTSPHHVEVGCDTMSRLERKVAMISGAARGSGGEAAHLMAHAGAKVMDDDVRDDCGRRKAAFA